MLADLESLERRIAAVEKKAKTNDKEANAQLQVMTKALALLREGKPARLAELAPEEREPFQQLGLMTEKPVLYVCNMDERFETTGNASSAAVEEKAKREGAGCVAISARIEEEVAQLHASERDEFLVHLGLEEPGLDRLIRAGYALLGLITFFTAGPKETRAWTIRRGARAPEAAGAIHTDFEKGFIRAETIAYEEYVHFGGEAGARDAGRMRLEGRDYVVRDGDVLHFRFA
jgi:hypothetical protein